jgi:hypothetical protein
MMNPPPVVAERIHGRWGVCGWRLHHIHGTTATLKSQSASCAGRITYKNVSVFNIRIVSANGNLEKINPYLF